jgi:hypothetical protein
VDIAALRKFHRLFSETGSKSLESNGLFRDELRRLSQRNPADEGPYFDSNLFTLGDLQHVCK